MVTNMHKNSASSNTYPPWEPAKTFTCPDTHLQVRVTKRTMPVRFEDGIPLDHFAFEISHCKPESPDKPMRFFPMITTVQDGSASIDTFPIGRLASLIDTAEGWVRDQRQEREDKVARQQLERSEKGKR